MRNGRATPCDFSLVVCLYASSAQCVDWMLPLPVFCAKLLHRYWKHHSSYTKQLGDFLEGRYSLLSSIAHGERRLQKLRRTNVCNDTFHIWYDGHFGTINNFRLGRLPSQPVDWNEINAAWGQVCMLTTTIADKLDFKFNTYASRV